MSTAETHVATNLSANTQQFADDDIVDNFGAGSDDGVPMGLGGEKGKQSEPASSTLEADIVAPTKQVEKPLPGVDSPPDNAAAGGEPQPVQGTAGDGGQAQTPPQVPVGPETPEFPDVLLQMAGFSSADDAKQFGFKDPEALLAAVQLQRRLLTQPVQPTAPAAVPPPKTPEAPPTTIPAQQPPQGDDLAFKPFEVPADSSLTVDELIAAQNKHYAAQFDAQQKRQAAAIEQAVARLSSRDEQQRQFNARAEQFDQAVQGLGPEWEAEFGKGAAIVLSKDDAAMQNRRALFQAAEVLRQANAGRGGKPMTVQQEVQWAIMQRYPDKFRQHLLQQAQVKATARRGTQASRPTARTTPPGGRNERLLSSLQEKYPQVDFSTGSGIGDEGEI